MDHRSLIRCAVPDCEWGFKSSDAAEMDNCYESFRLHCIAIHGLHPDDTESWMHFDLDNLILHLLKTTKLTEAGISPNELLAAMIELAPKTESEES
jgi:hypothetical protein